MLFSQIIRVVKYFKEFLSSLAQSIFYGHTKFSWAPSSNAQVVELELVQNQDSVNPEAAAQVGSPMENLEPEASPPGFEGKLSILKNAPSKVLYVSIFKIALSCISSEATQVYQLATL